MGARNKKSWYLQDNYCKKCKDRSYKRCILECEHYEKQCIKYEGQAKLEERRRYWKNVRYQGWEIYVNRNKVDGDFYK